MRRGPETGQSVSRERRRDPWPPKLERTQQQRVGKLRKMLRHLGRVVSGPPVRVAAARSRNNGAMFIRFLCARVDIGNLKVDAKLAALVKDEIAPGLNVDANAFWTKFGQIVSDLGPKNQALLKKRDDIQKAIDEWHLANKGPIDMVPYKAFLTSIGYLVPPEHNFEVGSSNVDPEIASTPGPQLVCPIDNARFILNAANARWGSLLDALYGTDAISREGGAEPGTSYNPVRGAKVFEELHRVLDEIFPLASGSYADATGFSIDGGKLSVAVGASAVGLKDPAQFVGYNEKGGALSSVLLKNNGLHIDILIDKDSPVGKAHKAGIKDVVAESALSAIADCEDSVAAVDADDKITCYRNWTGLMKGSLSASMSKGGKQIVRGMNPDRTYTSASGGSLSLPGRVVLLVRNVGFHIYTDAVTMSDGTLVPEHFLDAMVTTLASMHDLKQRKNSRAGSVYLVKPKMHGPEEVALASELFGRVEEALGLEKNTLKMGIMDEERRTSCNLGACMKAAKDRVVFINTGFLDRTGDEIHTSMHAGPFLPKAEIKKQVWIGAYEDNNVDVGIQVKLSGKGQIGKGMWAAPDNMKQMMKEKIGHPMAGANTAWTPSPTAATLHSLHYHRVNVFERQAEIAKRGMAKVEDILTVPLLTRKLTPEEVQLELDNNIQGLLGYVVRWIGQGVGCSKVPDISDVQLMEDRATLRISSQHVANWLHHKVTTEAQVMETMERMAAVVDAQNANDPNYVPMAPKFDGLEFKAAKDMIFKGLETPNGLTEFTLIKRRREYKAAHSK